MTPLPAARRRALLIRGGEAIYGPNWQSPLARALDINLRTIQRWYAGGPGAPPMGMLNQLIEHCNERIAVIAQVRENIAQQLSERPENAPKTENLLTSEMLAD
jgi:hypothetical protein